ncbi:hypothetical protein GQ54DRAFT_286501 [Martensiomyces pterosporus]|nr:hypothetical protein GQ54DRAFT_286501 [Martensiomyces pterosporus]
MSRIPPPASPGSNKENKSVDNQQIHSPNDSQARKRARIDSHMSQANCDLDTCTLDDVDLEFLLTEDGFSLTESPKEEAAPNVAEVQRRFYTEEKTSHNPADRRPTTPSPCSQGKLPVTPEANRTLPSSCNGSPKTRIHGKGISVGGCAWESYVGSNATLVDKSEAIEHVFSQDSGQVIAGLYPRRMGKSTFLSLVASFAGMITNIPLAQRMDEFKKYMLYDSSRQFFEQNFARYPVFHLDFKDHEPRSELSALKFIGESITYAAESYIETLCSASEGRSLSETTAHLSVENVQARKRDISILVEQYTLLASGRLDVDDAAMVNRFLPMLMKVLFFCLGRQKSVVLIDEFDAPLTNTFCAKELTADRRESIRRVYISFYTRLLKANEYLKKGILVGVFNAPCMGLGSGLNMLSVYMAHSGLSGLSNDANPFERAFGFTGGDVWSLICNFVDSQWKNRSSGNDEQFKKDLMIGCLRHFDGYRIGNSRYVFNPFAIVRFLVSNRNVASPKDVVFTGRNDWTSTGSTRMLSSIRASSIGLFRKYIDCLTSSYLIRYGYQSRSGIAQRLASVTELDDARLEEQLSQDPEQPPLDPDPETRKKLASLCMSSDAEQREDMLHIASSDLDADTIIVLLYQSGYLTPLSHDQVGIPNDEVLRSLKHLYQNVVSRTSISPDPLAGTLEAMGIREGNLVRLASYLDQCITRTPKLTEKTLESEYGNILYAYLYQVSSAGFKLEYEKIAENGRIDIAIIPENSGSGQGTAGRLPYYIFELKRTSLGTGELTYKEKMTANVRKRLEEKLENAESEAREQIDNQYIHTGYNEAKNCKMLLSVAIAFWLYRFRMVATRYKPVTNQNGDTDWIQEAYTNEEVQGMGTTNVTVKAENGRLVLSTVPT